METLSHDGQRFEKKDYAETKIEGREFTECQFVNCNFLKSDLSNVDFVDCIFSNCDMSLALLKNTMLNNTEFKDCKLVGLNFSVTNNFLFSVSFQRCILDYSLFFGKKMKKTKFIDCSLKEVEFEETDLSMVIFKNCDLTKTSFIRTVLEKTDFREARNFSFDPELNKMKKAKFSHLELAGLLTKYNLDIEFDA